MSARFTKTPWYLRLIGKPAWREKQPYLPGGWRYTNIPYDGRP